MEGVPFGMSRFTCQIDQIERYKIEIDDGNSIRNAISKIGFDFVYIVYAIVMDASVSWD